MAVANLGKVAEVGFVLTEELAIGEEGVEKGANHHRQSCPVACLSLFTLQWEFLEGVGRYHVHGKERMHFEASQSFDTQIAWKLLASRYNWHSRNAQVKNW